MVGVMSYDDFLALFNRCMDLLERMPPQSRETLLEVAASLLRLADEQAGRVPEPNAPTIHRLQ